MNGTKKTTGSVLNGEIKTPCTYRTLQEAFEENVDDIAEKVGIIYDGKRVSFENINKSANKVARQLLFRIGKDKSHAYEASDPVIAVNMKPSEKLVIAILAILKAGGAYLPIPSSLPPKRIAYILNDSNPIIAVVDKEAEKFPYEIPVLVFDDIIHNEECGENLSQNNSTLACVLYTSGSTGVPKGVRLPHKAVLNRLSWQWHELPYEPNEVGAFKTSITFVDHIAEIFGPLLKGIPLVIVPEGTTRNPGNFINLLEMRNVTRLVLVPSLLLNMITFLKMSSAQRNRLPKLSKWICSGDVLHAKLANEFFDYFADKSTLYNFYGSTEVMGDVSYDVFHSKLELDSKIKHGMVPIGKPIDNTILYAVDDQLQIVDEGKVGEIVVAGLNVSNGYVGESSDGSNKFKANLFTMDTAFSSVFLTGDYGFVEDGTMFFNGRHDNQVKLRGHKIDLQEIENAAQTVQGIESCAAICVTGETSQKLVVYFTNRPCSSCMEEIVHSALHAKLPSYMVPKAIKIAKFPLLPNGKIDREKLKEMFLKQQHDSSLEHAHDDNENAPEVQILLKTISIATGIPKNLIDLQANFFDIGGDSATVISTVMRLHEEGYTVAVGDFLTARTIADIVTLMQNNKITSLECKWSECTEKYKIISLSELEDPNEFIRIISDATAKKEPLTSNAFTPTEDVFALVASVWSTFVSEGLAYGIVDQNGRLVAGSLSFDFHNEPVLDVPDSFKVVMDVLEKVETPARIKLKGRGVFYNFLIATDLSLSYEENVQLTILLEGTNVQQAKKYGFDVAICVNTHDITKMICSKIFGYELIDAYKYKGHKWNGKKYYTHMPNEADIHVMVKYLTKEKSH